MMSNILAIDAGHGQVDFGAVGRVLREKDVTLDLAIKLHNYLAERGAESFLVREDDSRWPLLRRVEKVNTSGATHFMSLHINAFRNPAANGVEVFTSAPGGERTELAQKVQDALVKETGLRDRGVKHQSFYVLRNTHQPAILVELGFISNPHEHDLLMDGRFLDRAVKAIGNAYLAHIGFKQELEEWEKVILGKMDKPDDWITFVKDTIADPPTNHPVARFMREFIVKLGGE